MYTCKTCMAEWDGEASAVIHALDSDHTVFSSSDPADAFDYEPLDDPYFQEVVAATSAEARTAALATYWANL